MIKVDYKAGDIVYSKSDLNKGLYVVIRGLVEDALTLDTTLTLGVGSQISFANVVTFDGRSLTTLTCIRETSFFLVPT